MTASGHADAARVVLVGRVPYAAAMWNDGRMRGEVVPRDDRAWPRSSLLVSVVLSLAALGSGVGLAGIALPHRRAVLGRWYLSSLLSGERPLQPQRLTLQPPHPDHEVIIELGRDVGSFPAALAGRLTALAAFGLLFYWLT